MSADCKILLISDQEQMSEHLIQQALQTYPHVQQIAPTEVKIEIDRIAPDVVLLVQPEDGSGIELVQYIHSEMSSAIIVFITDKQDFLLLRDATRVGAVDFFVLPDETSQFRDRMERIVQAALQQNAIKSETAATGRGLRRGRGQIYTFFSGKGGSGCTLLATTYAQTFQLESTAQVLLIDLNLQYGGVETFLNIESNRSLADLQPVIDELNENHIRNVSEKEPYSKMELLLSPRDAEVAESISDQYVTKLIRACRRSYDFVIIDLPATMNAMTYTALEESDLIYYVMNLDMPSIRVYKRVEDLFKRLNVNTEGRMELVVNEKGRDNELNPSDLKNFMTVSVAAEVRRDLKGVQSAVNKGEPLRKQAKEKKITPVAKDIRKWVLSKLK